MIHLFVPKTESLELKLLGFDEPCFAFYDEEDINNNIEQYTSECRPNISDRVCYVDNFIVISNSQLDEYGAFNEKEDSEEAYARFTAPLYSQIFDWFRKKYKTTCVVMDFMDDETGIEWDYSIHKIGTDVDENSNWIPLVDYSTNDSQRKFKTYENAQLACLQKLITICKNDNTIRS